jgi:hypothetical protein
MDVAEIPSSALTAVPETAAALDLAAAIIETAVEDLARRPRKVREDAARFFHDGRLEILLVGFTQIDPDVIRSTLIRRGLLPAVPPPAPLWPEIIPANPPARAACHAAA